MLTGAATNEVAGQMTALHSRGQTHLSVFAVVAEACTGAAPVAVLIDQPGTGFIYELKDSVFSGTRFLVHVSSETIAWHSPWLLFRADVSAPGRGDAVTSAVRRSGRAVSTGRHPSPGSSPCRLVHCLRRVSHPAQNRQRLPTHPAQSGGRPSTASLRCSKSQLGFSGALASPGSSSRARR